MKSLDVMKHLTALGFTSAPRTRLCLNKIYLVNEGDGGRFNRGSFFFREKAWTEEEMEEVMYEIASRSIHYYFAKYGESAFAPDDKITV